jgi:hypothetical protein
VREAKELERLGLPLSTLRPIVSRESAKLQKSRFLKVQFQVELPKTFGKLLPESLGVGLVLEPNHDVIREPHDDDLAAGMFPTP